MAKHTGVLVGSASGACVDASIALARQLGPGKVVLTILTDAMERYLSKDWVKNLLRD